MHSILSLLRRCDALCPGILTLQGNRTSLIHHTDLKPPHGAPRGCQQLTPRIAKKGGKGPTPGFPWYRGS